jgi:hypothetical protein
LLLLRETTRANALCPPPPTSEKKPPKLFAIFRANCIVYLLHAWNNEEEKQNKQNKETRI